MVHSLNSSSEGTFPLILFFPGFACTVNAEDYSRVLTHIASWGYVVIGEVFFYCQSFNTDSS